MDYAVDSELTEEERMVEVNLQLKWGNHKSAASQPEKLKEKVDRDVKFGFAVPV